jgi:glutathione peroxidase
MQGQNMIVRMWIAIVGLTTLLLGENTMRIYDLSAKDINQQEVSFKKYENRVLLIVNVASHCGYTNQYEGLQKLYDTYQDKGLSILGFPCNQFLGQEPGTEEEIKSFCSLTYNVTFDMFAKIDVNGENTHPLYTFLKQNAKGLLGSEAIKWNFTKFLVDKEGNVIKRYAPATKPEEIESDIKELL